MEIVQASVFENAEGYERARIPGIICTSEDSLIAYCELRRGDSDWAVIDIGMKKSRDGGKSWSERKILASGGNENTVNNPVMIADEGCIHFLYCINYKRVYYCKSTDDGNSWSEPEEITSGVKKQEKDLFISCIATGPTHGIRLISGRLLVPVWVATNKEDAKSHHPSVIYIIYSDDKGKTWHTGDVYDGLSDASEFSLAQSSCGRIIANIRHENKERFRAVGEVTAENRITDVRLCEELSDPVCCAGMCSAGEEIFFSNCNDSRERKNLTLRRISENGRIIESILVSQEGGYSDIAVSRDKKYAYVLYESEKIIKCCCVRK